MSMALRTIESAMSRSRAQDVIAMLYSVHGGDAAMVSKYPGGKFIDNPTLKRVLRYQGNISDQNPM